MHFECCEHKQWRLNVEKPKLAAKHNQRKRMCRTVDEIITFEFFLTCLFHSTPVSESFVLFFSKLIHSAPKRGASAPFSIQFYLRFVSICFLSSSFFSFLLAQGDLLWHERGAKVSFSIFTANCVLFQSYRFQTGWTSSTQKMTFHKNILSHFGRTYVCVCYCKRATIMPSWLPNRTSHSWKP